MSRGSHEPTWVGETDTGLFPSLACAREQLCDHPGAKVENQAIPFLEFSKSHFVLGWKHQKVEQATKGSISKSAFDKRTM